jgi:hypothetical protein
MSYAQVVCGLLLPVHVVKAWILLQKQCTFWKSGAKFAKGKVFGILNQLKKLSESNYVRAHNVFLVVCNEVKIRVADGGDMTFLR